MKTGNELPYKNAHLGMMELILSCDLGEFSSSLCNPLIHALLFKKSKVKSGRFPSGRLLSGKKENG